MNKAYKTELNPNNKQITMLNRHCGVARFVYNCGNVKKELKLNERTYKCSECGLEIDRDLNAAINLKKYYTVGSTAKVCGEEMFILLKDKRCSSAKQEINERVRLTNFL